MEFALKPECHLLIGRHRQEVVPLLDKLGWQGHYEIETNSLQVQKATIIDNIPLDGEMCVCENLILSKTALYHGPREHHLSTVRGTPGNMGKKHAYMSVLRLRSGAQLVNWARFYDILPFTQTLRISSGSTLFKRSFISAGSIICGVDVFPQKVWFANTRLAYKDFSLLKPRAKYRLHYVQSLAETLETLFHSMGSISELSTGVFKIDCTEQITALEIGDVILFNKNFLLHIPSVEALCGFEVEI